MGIDYDKSTSPVSELAHAYTDFFLDREDKGFVHSDDELIVATVRLDAPNRKYWHCLTYNQIYSKFYRLFNMVIRSARFWNLFEYVDVYRLGAIYDLMDTSDNIGMESVPAVELMNSDIYSRVNSADKILGYSPRYYNWKTKIDRIHGAFTTTLKDWVAPVDDSFLYSLFGSKSTYKGITWPFFKVNPNTLDDIFAVKVDSTWNTDQLLVNCNVGCYVTLLIVTGKQIGRAHV